MRSSPGPVLAVLALAGFTAWITRQAKTLEQDLDASSQKVALLDQPAPDFRLTSLDGRAVSLADYRGKKKLVLVFWASWNNASHPEMLSFSGMYRRSHTPESEFEMVGIGVDDERAAAQAFVSQNHIPFPVLLDRNRSVTNAYRIRSVPTALLISAGGEVEFGSVGFTQRESFEFPRRLGIRDENFPVEMRAPNAGRGN
jgi:peroxiredoxin